jgi:hypothetical protein
VIGFSNPQTPTQEDRGATHDGLLKAAGLLLGTFDPNQCANDVRNSAYAT